MKRIILVTGSMIICSILFFALSVKQSLVQSGEYVCFPCGSDCDNIIHSGGGQCSDCRMELIEKSRVKFKNLSPEEVAEIISVNPGVVLLDVRTAEEFDGNGDTPRFSYGHLKNAINIPNTELVSRVSEIEKLKDAEIIVYCSHSHRSPYCAQQLTDLGFTNVKNMSLGMSSFVEKNLIDTKTGQSLIEKTR